MPEPDYIEQSSEVFDAIVVGSGITGGWAAKEFCERGYKTLMVERGRLVEHRKDYPTEGVPPWKMPNRGRVEQSVADRDHAVQQHCYAFSEYTRHFFGNDRELPYSVADGSRWSWIRANQLGGKSMLWARQSWRLSDFDFAANAADGHGNDWPIRYRDLAPWYSKVEIHAGISGSRDGLPQVPDSETLPPFQMSSPEKAFKAAVERQYPGRNVIMGRSANLSQPTPLHISQGRVVCQARSECERGCSFGASFSTQSSTLPSAAATGNLSIAANSVVHSLIYDKARNRVTGIRVIDNETLAEREYFGKVVFLCASTLGSTQILLMSGIANSSGVLGHYLMDHNYNARAHAEVPGFEDEHVSGRRPSHLYLPNVHYEPSRYDKGFLRGYAFGAGAYREPWQGRSWSQGLGLEFKENIQQAGPWKFNLWAMGEMLPRRENQVGLHPTLKDKWGIPQLHFQVEWSQNERDMMAHAAETGAKLLAAAGFEKVQAEPTNGKPGHAIHELGTARMGRDPADSVLNGYNQSHDVPNLFVTDGASFCSTATQNPSLTMMALTARAVDYAAQEMKQGRI
jgi:choline dehydrogenase-like flavoprotein